MPPARAVTADLLGAWLVKASGATEETRQHARAGFADMSTRCVRPSYRTDLVEAGQPVLLWISGGAPGLVPGIHARGWTTGRVRDETMPVELSALGAPVLRADLLHHPDLADLEVLRMPAGSNPSYVTLEQLAALHELCDELGHDPREAPGR